MRKRNWYTGQLVTEGQMDTAFSDVETAIFRANADFSFRGVLAGHVVAADSPASMDVVISGGTSYTPDGKRCLSVGDATLDCSVDVDSVSTNVVGINSSKVISVFVVFDRVLLEPQYDITNTLIYTIEEETCAFEVVQGNEVTSPTVPTAPSLRNDAVLLCDITLVSGQTTITSGDISTDRRQSLVVLTRADGSKIHNVTVEGAVQDVLDILEDHIAGTGENHDANTVEITVDTAVNWADGNDWCTTSPIGVTDAIQTHVVAKLASTGATSGAHRTGVAQSTYQSGTVPTLSAGTLFSRLEDLRNGANIYVASMSSWPDGTPALNNAASVFDAINTNVITRLGARVSAADQGCRRIGVYGTGYGLASWQALGATTVYGVFVGLNSATGTDGAAYVGAKASGALSAGTVRSQLDELDTRTTTFETDAYAYTTRAGVIQSLSGISSWTNSTVSKDITGIANGTKVRVTATFGIGGTPTGAYSLRLVADGVAIDGTEVDATISRFTLDGIYTIPSSGDYTFALQYQNPSTGMATMTIIGSASLIVQSV